MGNGNGTLDVGDLRVMVLQSRAAADATVVPHAPPNATPVTVLLLGQRTDGTPFMGEDQLEIKGKGGDA